MGEQAPSRWQARDLLRPENTGLLLDLTVFVSNLLLMDPLVRLLFDTVHRANAGDRAAAWTLWACTAAMFCLQPIGAWLKRWRYHERKGTLAVEAGRGPLAQLGRGGTARDAMEQRRRAAGCLFSPMFYFPLQLLLFLAVWAGLQQLLGAEDLRETPGRYFAVLGGGVLLVLASTATMNGFFEPPSRPPRLALQRSAWGERLGDACLFVNVLLFQTLWNTLAHVTHAPAAGVADVIGRMGAMLFLALLLYLPPRGLYLAEDGHRARTWWGMLLANAPILWRMIAGGGAG